MAVAAGDFNRDGKMDLAIADDFGYNVQISLGNGDGTFQPALFLSVGPGPVFAAIGDFNNDGKPDLAVGNSSRGSVSVLLGNGDGTFRPSVFYHSGYAAQYVAVADFNRDGIPDLAVADAGDLLIPGSSGVVVLLGKGDGTFQHPAFFHTGSVAQSIAMGDFNRDGQLDLAVANRNASDISSHQHNLPAV